MGLLLVGDDEVVGVEDALHSIQGAELFAFAGSAHDDAAFELVEIEDVGRLSDGERAVVGGVDGVGYGLLLEQAEALGDDASRGLDGDVAEDAGGEASAEFGFFDGDGKCGAGMWLGQCDVDGL